MAGISRKRKIDRNGKEHIIYVISYRDIYGKQHTGGYYKTLKEARKDLGKYETLDPEVKEITFEKLFQVYLEKAESKYSHTTLATYKLYINMYFSKLFPIKYSKVSVLDLERFIRDIEHSSTPYVAQTCLKMANACVNYAKKLKLVKENKFSSVSKISIPDTGKNHLTSEEINHVLMCCKEYKPDYYLLFLTLMTTGIRIGEALALDKKSFDFNENKILINKQFTKGKLRLVTKTKSEPRPVYIPDNVAEILKEHIEKLEDDNQLVFPNKANHYQSADNLRERVWKPLLEYAGISKRVRIHDIRGSYIDTLLSSGLSVKFTQNQVGHSKAQTTLDIYAKNNSDMIYNAMEVLNNVYKV